MAELYPEPPHLTVAVYSKLQEDECFAALCQVVEASGCTPNGTVEVAPRDAIFELRSDLAGQSTVLDIKREQFYRVVAGSDAGRVVRAGFHRKGGELVLVEYLPAPGSDRHPIAASISAKSLGIPIEMWGKVERSAAAKLASWSKNLLLEASDQCNALYAAIGIECSLATPSELAGGLASLPSEVFVAQDILETNPKLNRAFAEDFQNGVVIEWSTGRFYSGWAPFNARHVSMSGGAAAVRKSSTALGRAVLSR